MNWLERSRQLLRAATTPFGIRASLVEKDNYGAIFTRDAVMAGIAGVLLKDEIIIEGFKQSLIHLKFLQGKQGQIASNFTTKDGEVDHVSFGTLSPKIDSCTWYLIGVGLLVKEGVIKKEEFRSSVEKTIDLLDAIEYNGKHLMYIPKGGNWADEFCYEGYILYDQVLRAWGLSILASTYEVKQWSDKSNAIQACIAQQFRDKKNKYLNSSIFPGGVFSKFDLAAHAILGIVFGMNESFVEQSLEWISNEFISKGKLPPSFYPVINEGDIEWESLRKYHLFGFKNKPHHYHNGGIWWIWVGWLSVALSLCDKKSIQEKLTKLSFEYLNSLDHFEFDEYVSADDLIPKGTKQLCYTATGIIFLSLADDPSAFLKLQTKVIPLIKESIELKNEYFDLSSEIVDILKYGFLPGKSKLIIGICGESGSGKSVTARCLQIELEKQNIPTIILHQDSYYKLPPKENHLKRKSDLNWVGSNELNLNLLQSHIEQFKWNGESINAPIVDYEKNVFLEHQINIKDKSVLIVEGVYTFLLDQLDCKIFMERTYQETLEKRKNRNREVYDPFVEEVLRIEQGIVKPLRVLADLIVGNDYSLSEKGSE